MIQRKIQRKREMWAEGRGDRQVGMRGKRRGGRALTALFALFLTAAVWISAGTGTAYGSQPEADITMEVSYGFGEMAKGDRYLPIRISLTNRGESDFAGTAQILTTASSMEPYRYDYPISVDSLSSSEHVYEIPLGVRGDQVFITLRGFDGSEIVRKRLKLNISKDVSEVFVGLLCDTPEMMRYMDEVGIRYGSIKTKLVPLAEKTAPEESLGYDQLDLLVVTGYDLNLLTRKQQDAALEWVENGGTLLFGGGADYKRHMGSLAAELLEPPYEEPKSLSVNLGAEYSQNVPQDAVLDMVCADLNLKNGSPLMSGDGLPLLSYVRRGRGRIAIAAFDLRDIRDFCESHPSFLEKFLTLTFGETKTNELCQLDYFGFSNLYFSIQGLINTGNVDRLPNVILYTVVIILYILLIGPGLYHLLKKKSMQRYYIGGVAALSLLFAAVIYGMGTKTRFRAPFFTYVTVLDATGGQREEETLINVRSPYNKPYTVKFIPGYTIRPITKSYYYDSVTAAKFTGEEEYQTCLSFNGDETELSIRDTAAFTPKMFSLMRKLPESQADAGVGGTVESFDGDVAGTVTNHFSYTLEDAALLLYGKAVLLGDLEPGQTVELSGREVVNYPLNYTYALAQTLAGGDTFEKVDINDKSYMLSQERSRLLSVYIERNVSGYTPEARLVAFSPDKNRREFLKEGDFATEGITMVTASLPVKRERDGRIYRSALEQEPNVISGSYQLQYNTIYIGEPAEPTVVEYSLGNDLAIDEVVFEYLSPIFRENPKYPYLTMFEGEMYFYNYNTGHNDLMEEGKTRFTAEDLRPYLSPDNTLTIKYVGKSKADQSWDRLLPMLYVIGEEK